MRILAFVYAFSSRGIVILLQMIIAFFVFYQYGAMATGYYGLAQGVAAIVLSASTIGVPKLVAVRYKSRSKAYFDNCLYCAAIIFLPLYLLIVLVSVPFDSLVVVLAAYVLKIVDLSVQINSVYYRRWGAEPKLMRVQLVRLFSVLFGSAFAYVFGVSINEYMFLLAVLMGGVWYCERRSMRIGRKYISAIYRVNLYCRLLKTAYHNAFGYFLSSFISVMPRYAVLYLVDAAAVGVFMLLSYVYVAITNFWSIVMQTLIIKNKNKLNIFGFIKKIHKYLIVFYCFFVPVWVLFGEWVVSLYIKSGKIEGIWESSLYLVLVSYFMVVRELYVYSLIKIDKVWISNSSSIFAAAVFCVSCAAMYALGHRDGGLVFVMKLYFFANLLGYGILSFGYYRTKVTS